MKKDLLRSARTMIVTLVNSASFPKKLEKKAFKLIREIDDKKEKKYSEEELHDLLDKLLPAVQRNHSEQNFECNCGFVIGTLQQMVVLLVTGKTTPEKVVEMLNEKSK